jgi:hypothetical protein
MNTQDIMKIGRKARIETEAFINRHINDEAKRWPIICPCGQPHNSYHLAGHRTKSGIGNIFVT